MNDEWSVMRRMVQATVFIGLLSGCSSAPEKLGQLDLVKWREDRAACAGIRSGLVKDFKVEQANLMGKFADDVGEMLGKPDIHQLAGRNQKLYVYFLEKGPQCEDITNTIPGVESNFAVQRGRPAVGDNLPDRFAGMR